MRFSLIRILTILCISTSVVFAQTSPQDYLTAAQQAFNNGYTDIAIKYAKEFKDKFPAEHLPAMDFLLGQCYFTQGQYQQALDAFETITDDTLENKDALLFWKAEAANKLGLVDRSNESYQSLLTQFPQSSYVVQSLYSLGWSSFEKGEYQQAIDFFNQLRIQYPDSSLVADALFKEAEGQMRLLDYKNAQVLFSQFLSRFPNHEYMNQAKADLADILYNQGNYPRALEIYLSLWSENNLPTEIKAIVLSGILWVYTKQHDLEKMNEWELQARKFLEDNQHNNDLRLVLGAIALEQSAPQKALEWLLPLINTQDAEVKAESLLGAANAYYALGNYSKALTYYQQLLTENKDGYHLKAITALAWCYVSLGQREKALEYFRMIVDKSSTESEKLQGYQQMVDGLSSLGMWDEAIKVLSQMLPLVPKDGLEKYEYQLINVYIKSNQIEKAHQAIDVFIQQYPKSSSLGDLLYFQGVIAFKQSNYKDADLYLDQFLRGLKMPSQFTAQANYLRAMSLFNVGNLTEAQSVFQKIIRLYPDNTDVAPYADMGIAQCYIQLKDMKEASRRLKMIAFKYPQHAVGFDAMWHLAQDEVKLGHFNEAIDWYKRMTVFESHPRLPEVLYELAQVYEMLDDFSQALSIYQQIQTNNQALQLKVRISQANLMVNQGNIDGAKALYQEIITQNVPASAQAVIKLGQIYRDAQQFEKEFTLYQQSLQRLTSLDPGIQAQLMFLLGDSLELMSRTEEAIEQYLNIVKKFQQNDPWVVKAFLRVAKIYEDNKDWVAAKLIYQQLKDWPIDEAKFAQEQLEMIEKLKRENK